MFLISGNVSNPCLKQFRKSKGCRWSFSNTWQNKIREVMLEMEGGEEQRCLLSRDPLREAMLVPF